MWLSLEKYTILLINMGCSNNQAGPCIDKKCSWCCDPVKVPVRFPSERIPKNEDGTPMWEKTGGIVIPDNGTEKDLYSIYKCEHLDHVSGECGIYNKRPEICRATSCIEPESKKMLDEQHQEMIQAFSQDLGKKR